VEVRVFGVSSRSRGKHPLLSAIFIAIIPFISFGAIKLRPASRWMHRAAVRLFTIESGPMICIVEGLGTLVTEETRSVRRAPRDTLDQIFLRPARLYKPTPRFCN